MGITLGLARSIFWCIQYDQLLTLESQHQTFQRHLCSDSRLPAIYVQVRSQRFWLRQWVITWGETYHVLYYSIQIARGHSVSFLPSPRTSKPILAGFKSRNTEKGGDRVCGLRNGTRHTQEVWLEFEFIMQQRLTDGVRVQINQGCRNLKSCAER